MNKEEFRKVYDEYEKETKNYDIKRNEISMEYQKIISEINKNWDRKLIFEVARKFFNSVRRDKNIEFFYKKYDNCLIDAITYLDEYSYEFDFRLNSNNDFIFCYSDEDGDSVEITLPFEFVLENGIEKLESEISEFHNDIKERKDNFEVEKRRKLYLELKEEFEK